MGITASTASGSWENYHVTDEQIHIANLFVNNFTKKMANII
jgi:hypothetical protein